MPKKPKITFMKTGEGHTYSAFEGGTFIGSLVPIKQTDFKRFPGLWAGENGIPPWWKVINRDGVLLGLVAYNPNGHPGDSTWETRRMSAAKILVS